MATISDFIYFMTYNDSTVEDALEVFKSVEDTGLQNIGFKDVGLPTDELTKLNDSIKKSGLTRFLEVVSEDEKSTLRSARTAVELDVDYLIGGYGEYAEEVQHVLADSGVKFFPYIGKVSGIPGKLEGEIQEIVEEAREKEKMGVDGIDLLTYRYTGNSEKLLGEVVDSVSIPVIVAGSIDGKERIDAVKFAGASMFTIGTAIFDRQIAGNDNIEDEIEAVLSLV